MPSQEQIDFANQNMSREPEKQPAPKEVLLSLISQRFGPNNAMLAEEAFKNQAKQVKEAMGQGMTAEELLKTRGIDLNQIGGGLNPNSQMLPAKGIFSQPKVTPEGNIQQGGAIGQFFGQSTDNLLNQLLKLQQINGQDSLDKQSLRRNRDLESDLMEKQLAGGAPETVYRDPVTGAEVDAATAEQDMKEGLGIYQKNQRLSTRAGVIERPMNKIPDLTEGEKKYVNDARIMSKSLETLDSGFDRLFDKYGASNWQSFQIEKMPYILTQDQEVQDMKSELVYLKAAIPFLRGGKALTATEAERVDAMLNPFGKSRATYKRDIARFQDEFLVGAEIQKYGVNSGLMKKLIKGGKKSSAGASQADKSMSDMSDDELRAIINGG